MMLKKNFPFIITVTLVSFFIVFIVSYLVTSSLGVALMRALIGSFVGGVSALAICFLLSEFLSQSWKESAEWLRQSEIKGYAQDNLKTQKTDVENSPEDSEEDSAHKTTSDLSLKSSWDKEEPTPSSPKETFAYTEKQVHWEDEHRFATKLGLDKPISFEEDKKVHMQQQNPYILAEVVKTILHRDKDVEDQENTERSTKKGSLRGGK